MNTIIISNNNQWYFGSWDQLCQQSLFQNLYIYHVTEYLGTRVKPLPYFYFFLPWNSPQFVSFFDNLLILQLIFQQG